MTCGGKIIESYVLLFYYSEDFLNFTEMGYFDGTNYLNSDYEDKNIHTHQYCIGV